MTTATTRGQQGTAPRAPLTTPEPDHAPLRKRRRGRVLLQIGCIAVTLFMGCPIYLIALAAFSTRESLNQFPLDLLPVNFSTETIGIFMQSTGILAGVVNSIQVGLATLVLSFLIGIPAGYAVARFAFRGRDPYQLFMLFTRALPIVVLSVPLAQLFLGVGLYDSVLGVVLLHSALALPTSILITAAVFVGVPADVEEAARIFGCTPLQAFRKVVLPMATTGDRRRRHLHLRDVVERGPRCGHPHPEPPHVAGPGALVALGLAARLSVRGGLRPRPPGTRLHLLHAEVPHQHVGVDDPVNIETGS